MTDYNENARKWLEGDFDPETKCKVIDLRTGRTGFVANDYIRRIG